MTNRPPLGEFESFIVPDLPDNLPEPYVPVLGEIVEFHDGLGGPPHRFPGAYKVVKINPRTVDVEGPTGLKVRADRYCLRKTAKPFVASATPRLHLGTVVKFTRAYPNVPEGTRLVVVKVNVDTVNLARLGGDPEGRYYRSVPITQVETVEV